jgi:hypothetical protein
MKPPIKGIERQAPRGPDDAIKRTKRKPPRKPRMSEKVETKELAR